MKERSTAAGTPRRWLRSLTWLAGLCAAGWMAGTASCAELVNPAPLPANSESVWAAWTGASGQTAAIFCSRRENGNWSVRQQVSRGPESAFSPSVAVDSFQKPWVVWTSKVAGVSSLFSSTLQGDQGWSQPKRLCPSDTRPASTPALARTGVDRLSAVWAGFDGTDDDIFYSACRDGVWSNPVLISANDTTPDIDPVVIGLDNGDILVVWSGYDGRAYRLLYALFDHAASAWTPEKTVTSGIQAQELPFFGRNADGLPQLFWSEGGQMFSALFSANAWSEPKAVTPAPEFFDLPQKIDPGTGGRVWLSWTGQAPAQQGWSVRCNATISPAPAKGAPAAGAAVPAAASVLADLNALAGLFCSTALAAVNEPQSIVAVGDSITAGWKGEDFESRLATILNRTVYNSGVPGERVSSALGRIDNVLSHYSSGSLIIWEGTNDAGDGHSPEYVAFTLSEIADRARSFGTTPYIGTLLPRNDIFNGRVEEINAAIRTMASTKGFKLVEMYNSFAGRDLSTVYEDNRLHPNALGYDIAASLWAGAFKSSGGGSGGGCGHIRVTGSGGSGINLGWLLLTALWLLARALRRPAMQRA